MKYAYALAFGALALAQPAPGDDCISIVTEVAYTTVTYCPCSSSSLTLASTSTSTSVSVSVSGTSSASSSSSDGGQVGPTLTNGQTTSTTGTSSVSIADPPIFSTTTSSGTLSASIGDPTLTSISLSSVPTLPPGSTTASTTTTVPAVPSSGVPAGTTQTISLATLGDYQTRALLSHNLHRDNSSIPRLVWNATQAAYAQQLAQTCVYAHSNAQGDGQYGQNIGAGFTADQIPVMITNSMYNGEINFFPGYGQNNVDLSNFGAWGHFSQLIWTDTISVGCFTADCSATGLANTGGGVRPLFTVCNYYPPGNIDGLWSRVAQPLGGGSVVFV